ncbi:hexokinase-domain-containing protein [Jimgerdemannia flammicorona]|uniref:Phosphotransferase n=1 Tax=Jimgerdemannia flammicorona TaxID=994334 RepID=A0A433D348_9FUNG|nr:hexokinase-domain-containing protein [Jimgerdemannia flammicorona]
MSVFSRRQHLAVAVEDVGGTQAQHDAVAELIRAFTVSADKLRAIQTHFISEMEKGLKHHGQTVAMIPSFVEGRLTGQEKGTFLALDLGGTNLRVVQVELLGAGEFTTKSTKYKVSEELKTTDAKNLFRISGTLVCYGWRINLLNRLIPIVLVRSIDFIADSIDSFLAEHGLDAAEEAIPLGFTFSFPVYQSKINRGTLKSWTKGFSCPGLVGKDPVVMLQDALAKKHVPVFVTALVNDTVGTLLSHAYRNPDTMAGIILGTGTNGAYIENMKNIEKWDGGSTSSNEMIINMEFGAFDNERRALPLTMFDNKLDRESINPHEQIFEKMIAGMYLGEIVRNTLLHLIDRELLFSGNSSKELNEMWSLETTYMSAIEADADPQLESTKNILEQTLSIPSTTLTDRRIVKKVCELVGTRAARLASAAIGGIIAHRDALEAGCACGIDGSLYEFYPNFETRMYAALKELFGEGVEKKIRLGLAKDGSGVGGVAAKMFKSLPVPV